MAPVLHFMPAKGWLNDPNGLIEYRGVHHLFFQHNPDTLAMKDMCWGHASSTDLLTWTEHAVALRPGPPGSYDGDGCWSGCAVAGEDGVVVLYSGNNAGIQLPCVARPLDDDLITWEKAPANPVIRERPPLEAMTDMRDHSVRRDGDLWRQVLAAGVADEGMLVGYSSVDLTNWEWDGIVLRAGDTGMPGQIWECPDVFEKDGHAVAVISVIEGEQRPGPVIWVTGHFDGSRLTPTRWGLLDYGHRYYAPQSYNDHTGRRISIGWLLTQLDPAAQGQASIGVTSLPRILSVVDGRVVQRPVAEIRELRRDPAIPSSPESDPELRFDLTPTDACEVEVACEPGAALLGTSVTFEDGDGHEMTVDLRRFATGGRVRTTNGWQEDVYVPRTATLIFDTGIVEVFTDDGRAAALTDCRLGSVYRVSVRGGGGTPPTATVWPLSR